LRNDCAAVGINRTSRSLPGRKTPPTGPFQRRDPATAKYHASPQPLEHRRGTDRPAHRSRGDRHISTQRRSVPQRLVDTPLIHHEQNEIGFFCSDLRSPNPLSPPHKTGALRSLAWRQFSKPAPYSPPPTNLLLHRRNCRTHQRLTHKVVGHPLVGSISEFSHYVVTGSAA
jgi:hypothetical protein